MMKAQLQLHAPTGVVMRPAQALRPSSAALTSQWMQAAAPQRASSRRSRAVTLRCQAVAPAVAQAPRPEEKFEPQVCVVLGTQWGDEGKGKLVDILAQEYEIVARAQVRAGCCAVRAAVQSNAQTSNSCGSISC